MAEFLDANIRMLEASVGRKTRLWTCASHDVQYRPHFRVGADGEYLGVTFLDGPGWLEPGAEGDVTVALAYTETGVDYSPLQVGVEFRVVEGANEAARGTVLRRYSRDGQWRDFLPPA